MTRALILSLLLSVAAPVAVPVWAVQPDEILPDAGLEARARALSKGLRCPVCQNENIDDSDAPIARDLRILLRERLTAGDSDAEAVAFIVDRYGEFVLLNPPAKGSTLFLWLAGPLMLLAGGGIAYAALRARGTAAPAPALSAEEEARVAELLRSER